MISTTFNINKEQKKICAILVMRSMLEDYSEEYGISFEEAFFKFVFSKVYDMLFDYSTGLWKEGPDYLRDTFDSVAS